jgi:DNA-binding response OmpR family regulator
MKLLVVENNPLIARAVETAGEHLKMDVDRATDGWEAIGFLENVKYDAIVIDADLPRHSGYGVLAFLHEEIGRELPNVLVISADTDSVRRHVVEGTVRVMRTTDDLAAIESGVREVARF